MDQYQHGVKIVEKSEGPRPIRTVQTAVIGVVGTAPDAAAAVAAELSIGSVTSDTGIHLTAVTAGAPGNSISLALVDPGDVSQALAVTVNGNAISVSLETDVSGALMSTATEVIAAITGDVDAAALVTAADSAGSDGSGTVAAMAALTLTGGEDEPYPLNTPVLIVGSRSKAAKLDAVGDGAGTLPGVMDAIFDQIAAMVVVVRVAEDAEPATQTSNVIGGTDANGQNTGLYALLDAEAELGVKPRILGAPGFDVEAAVAAEMVVIADRLRGFAYVGVTAATKEDAVIYRDSFGAKRMMLIWPDFTAWDTGANATVTAPASARALGLRARIDNEYGWHKTLSNISVNGVTGLSKSVDFNLTDPNTAANYLNENEVTTLIRKGGFRFWGSRTCSVDPLFAFESAVRTNDILADTIAEAHMWAIDLPMSKTLIKELVEGINAKFRTLKTQGLIVDAEAYIDEDINGETELAAGKLTISYDYTPVPPLENLILEKTITSKYLVQLVS